MHTTNSKPTGTVTGFIRMVNDSSPTETRIADLTRYELPSKFRFREENWMLKKHNNVLIPTVARNTDDFNRMQEADSFLQNWIEAKKLDGFVVSDTQGLSLDKEKQDHV